MYVHVQITCVCMRMQLCVCKLFDDVCMSLCIHPRVLAYMYVCMYMHVCIYAHALFRFMHVYQSLNSMHTDPIAACRYIHSMINTVCMIYIACMCSLLCVCALVCLHACHDGLSTSVTSLSHHQHSKYVCMHAQAHACEGRYACMHRTSVAACMHARTLP